MWQQLELIATSSLPSLPVRWPAEAMAVAAHTAHFKGLQWSLVDLQLLDAKLLLLLRVERDLARAGDVGAVERADVDHKLVPVARLGARLDVAQQGLGVAPLAVVWVADLHLDVGDGARVRLVADPELDGFGTSKWLVAFGAAATAGPRHATWAAAARVRVSGGGKEKERALIHKVVEM